MKQSHRHSGQASTRKRREAPQEKTGLETVYINNLVRKKTPLVVKLVTGEEIRGYIQYYDRKFIRVTCPDGNRFFIFKHDIKYFYEEPV
jgi:sRNA-binding regulator protein Hfq